MSKTDNNKKKFLEALERCLGVVTTACEKSNTSRSQVYHWMESDKDFKTEVDFVRNEVCVDFAESNLFKQIKNQNTTATIFFLKTRGKHRGYVETTQTEIKSEELGKAVLEFVKKADD